MLVCDRGDFRVLFDNSKEIWRLDDNGGNGVIHGLPDGRGVDLTASSEINQLNFNSKIAGICRDDSAIFRMNRFGNENLVPLRYPVRHQDGFCQSRASIV